MTRDELLRKLEDRLEATLRKHGVSASVVSLRGSHMTLPISMTGVGGKLSNEVLEVVRATVRDFIVEHDREFSILFAERTDPKLLN